MLLRLKYLNSFCDRRGVRRYYVRIRGKRTAMQDPGNGAVPTVEFIQRYREITTQISGAAVTQKRAARARASGTIYVVGFGNYVKIGYTRDPAQRLADLQTGCPEQLTIYLHLAGSLEDEASLHRRFRAQRAKGEWFRLSGDLAKWIKSEKVHQRAQGESWRSRTIGPTGKILQTKQYADLSADNSNTH